MAKVQGALYMIMFVTHVLFASCILANEIDDDPRTNMENLGALFKMMSGSDNECKISCPQGSVPVPRPGHAASSNGCGSLGIKLDTSTFPGFEQCCDAHDKCYDTCNKNRDKCDAIFQDCLNKVCDGMKKVRSSDQVQLCENAGGLMHAAAMGLGCTSFTQAQNKACVCSGHAIEDDGSKSKKRGKKAEL